MIQIQETEAYLKSRSHFMSRLRERFGIKASSELYEAVRAAIINAHPGIARQVRVAASSKGRETWIINIAGKYPAVWWCSRRKLAVSCYWPAATKYRVFLVALEAKKDGLKPIWDGVKSPRKA